MNEINFDHVFYLTEDIRNIFISACNQYKVIEIFFLSFFFLEELFKILRVFYIYGISQFSLAAW